MSLADRLNILVMAGPMAICVIALTLGILTILSLFRANVHRTTLLCVAGFIASSITQLNFRDGRLPTTALWNLFDIVNLLFLFLPLFVVFWYVSHAQHQKKAG